MEPLEPIGRPEVKVNETLVQEQYENTAFTSEEPMPNVIPVPVPMRYFLLDSSLIPSYGYL